MVSFGSHTEWVYSQKNLGSPRYGINTLPRIQLSKMNILDQIEPTNSRCSRVNLETRIHFLLDYKLQLIIRDVELKCKQTRDSRLHIL